MLNVLRNQGKKLISGLVLSGIVGLGGLAAAQEQPAPSCCTACSCGREACPCGDEACSCGDKAGSCSCQSGSCGGGNGGSSCGRKPEGQPSQRPAGSQK